MVKKKYIEQSKVFSIRLPISRYSRFKERIEELVEQWCEDEELFAPEEEYNLNDILGGI